MLVELDATGVVLGHSERRQYYNETDRALQQKVPKALESGLVPILCVGETEEERERGDTERKLRHQVQEGLDKVPIERLPEVVVAYEPVWAIGTGLTATSEQAQEAVAFVRALVEGFDKAAGQAVRILYGGSLKPDNAEELLGLPDVDGALIGGASLDAGDFAKVIQTAARMTTPHDASPPVCLVVLDGWGLAPDGPGNAVSLAETPVFDRIWEEHPHTTLIACGESVGLPAGQMGNSEVGHLNLGAGAIVPQDLARIDKAVEDGTLGENEVLQETHQRRRARPPDRARVRRRGALLRRAPEGARRAGRGLGRARRRRPRLHRRPRHVAQGRGEVPRRGRELGRRARRERDRPLLRDGPRQALGPHAEGVRPARARQGRPPRRHGRAGRQGRLRARRDGRVHHRHHGRRGGEHPPR